MRSIDEMRTGTAPVTQINTRRTKTCFIRIVLDDRQPTPSLLDIARPARSVCDHHRLYAGHRTVAPCHCDTATRRNDARRADRSRCQITVALNAIVQGSLQQRLLYQRCQLRTGVPRAPLPHPSRSSAAASCHAASLPTFSMNVARLGGESAGEAQVSQVSIVAVKSWPSKSGWTCVVGGGTIPGACVTPDTGTRRSGGVGESSVGTLAIHRTVQRCCAWRARRELWRGDTTLTGKVLHDRRGAERGGNRPGPVSAHRGNRDRGTLCAAENSGRADRRRRSRAKDTVGGDRMHTYRVRHCAFAVCAHAANMLILLESMHALWHANHSTIISRWNCAGGVDNDDAGGRPGRSTVHGRNRNRGWQDWRDSVIPQGAPCG